MEMPKLDEILQNALERIKNSNTIEALTNFKNDVLSKKSDLMSFMNRFGSAFDLETKKRIGMKLNEVKQTILEAFNEKMEVLKKEMLNKKLKNEQIDISLPGIENNVGGRNPFHIVIDEITQIFLDLGFEIAEGPEVELDKYNFELLNIPKDHPARDMQDSFYFNANTLLRTHTSPIQARTMEIKKGEPIKIICPGKTFRRDNDDNTHSHQFGQIEGLVVDKDINLGNLKATLSLFATKMFDEKTKIRFRPSYFPFTEPSVEVDVSCVKCGGKGCPICKGTGYIELLGGGMVHPNVLKMCGYDPEIYSGFAFGIGIDRAAMFRFGIDDVRKIYSNDIRLLSQFKMKA